MIKLIGFDLDDTLLNNKREIQDILGLKQAIKNNVKICFCSGRPYLDSVKNYYKDLGLTKDTYYVAYNGVVIYNIADDSVLYSNKLAISDIKIINDIIDEKINNYFSKDNFIKYIYNENNEVIANGYSKYVQIENTNNNAKIIIGDYLKYNAYKFMISGKPEFISELYKYVKDELSENYETFISMPCYIEVIKKGVDKYDGLYRVSQAYGYKENEIMAFGDSMNDYTLIKKSYIGVAMGNSVEKIKEIADFITEDNDNYGITKALVKYNVIKKSDISI